MLKIEEMEQLEEEAGGGGGGGEEEEEEEAVKGDGGRGEYQSSE